MAFRPLQVAARATPHVLLLGILVTFGVAFHNWANVTTYRLYLDHRIDDAAHSTATQRFDLEQGRVVAQILMRDDRIAFRTALARPAVIRAGLSPAGPASYELRAGFAQGDRTLCRGEMTAATSIACALPADAQWVALTTRGSVTWSDLRAERQWQMVPELTILILLSIALVVWSRSSEAAPPPSPIAFSPDARRRWAAAIAVITTTIVTFVGLEASLRAVGARWLSAVSAARHDLGELTDDPRWQHTARYGLRLAVNSDASNVWQYGDIVRMGFLPPAVAEGRVHRFGFHTDREGFRNAAVRDRIDVAALGDSFTDALTMAVGAGWPGQLEQQLGARVQNYGTAGFGPQQELRVLEDFALPHHPHTVVLAFFAGNDIRDAEVFELTGRTDVPLDHPAIGWPVKPIVSRADTWYLMNVTRAAATTIGLWRTEAIGAVSAHAAEPPAAGPSFDRGMFTVPVNGRALKVAFMPPYLNMLTFSAADLARRGWTLIQDSIGDMDRVSRAAGARFVVMFLPFKSQVYLPLLSRIFSKDDLNAALRVALQPMHSEADLDRLLGNRLALNLMMRDFCARAGIAFLDTTSALEARLAEGENVYFPDDSHLNETGEAVVAQTLARFLRALR